MQIKAMMEAHYQKFCMQLILYLRKRQAAIIIRIATLLHIQVKTYLPVHGKPDVSDKGYVSTYYIESKYAWIFRLTVLLAFVFLNILTPIVLAKAFSQYYSKIRANVSAEDFTKCLYQATAFASFLCNVAYTTVSIWNYSVKNDSTIAACVIFFLNILAQFHLVQELTEMKLILC